MNLKICAFDRKDANISCFKKSDIKKILGYMGKKFSEEQKKKELFDILTENLDPSWSATNPELYIVDTFEKNPKVDKTFSDLLKSRLAPIKPSSAPDDWPLTNFEVDILMKQFQKKYKNFFPLKTWYIEAPKMIPEYRPGSILSLSKKFNKVGFIFNTDHVPGSGIHWIAVLLDFSDPTRKKTTFEYYDSFGRKMLKELVNYNKELSDVFKELETKTFSKKRQGDTSAVCGIYSLYFINKRLEGKTFEELENIVVNDGDMMNYRFFYFRK